MYRRETLVFQYGSNMSTARFNANNRLAGAATAVSLARTVKRFRFDFTVWSKDNECAAADIVLDGSGRQIWGVLYSIPTDRISRDTTPDGTRALDSIEGEGTNYLRHRIAVLRSDINGPSTEALTYVVKERRAGLRTSLQYARHILCGLREHDAPTDYVQYVIAQIVMNNPDLDEALRQLGEGAA